VFVCRSQDDVDEALRAVSRLGVGVVVEELLEGPELSLLALCDGRDALPLAPAQDFKRAFDGDRGPNTGGMGSYAPVPGLDEGDVEELLETVHRPVLAELQRRGAPFVGILYAGLMLTAEGPRVLEFNCRFGDPETQSVLPLVRGDLGGALAAAAAGDLAGVSLDRASGAAVTVVLAASGYPERGDRGTPIVGIDRAEARGALVFHAGTALHGDTLVANGGRILGVTGLGETVAAARDAAYAAVSELELEGARYRADIAAEAATGRTFTLVG
jgi:phosphoribosylamine--glycine ligase